MLDFLFAQVVSQTTYTCVNSKGRFWPWHNRLHRSLSVLHHHDHVFKRTYGQGEMNTGRWLLTFHA